MKRLGIIVFMALVLTVGGVYATFNYAQNDVIPASQTLTPNIEDAVLTTPKGTIDITKNDFVLTVDDLDGNLKTKYTATYATTPAHSKVTFTPAQGADATVTANGIKLKLVIEFVVAAGYTNEYKGTPIFKHKTAYTTGGVVLNSGNNVLGETTFNLADYIDVSEIDLPTYAEYQAYREIFEKITIKITVSETA